MWYVEFDGNMDLVIYCNATKLTHKLMILLCSHFINTCICSYDADRK